MAGLSDVNSEVVNLVEKGALAGISGAILMQKPDLLNAIIHKVWSGLETYLEKLLVDDLTKLVSEHIKGFKFDKLDFGTIPPKLSNIKLYTGTNMEANEIVIDVDVLYSGNMVVKATWNLVGLGIHSVKLACALRLRLAPLLAQPPFFGCISVSMLQPPKLAFEGSGVAGVIDFKPVSDALQKFVSEKLQEVLVVPNAIVVPIGAQKDDIDYPLTEFRCRVPRGVLQVLVVEASELANHDVFSKTDAIVRVCVGADVKSTRTINDNNDPRWLQSLEFDIRESAGTLVNVDLVDDDSPRSPELVGHCSTLDFRDAIARVEDGALLSDLLVIGAGSGPAPPAPAQFDTKWYPLLDTKNGCGRLRLGFRYFDFVEKPQLLRTTGKPVHTAVCVFVHRAQLAAHGKQPTRVSVKLLSNGTVINGTTENVTSIIRDSTEPTWNAYFRWQLPSTLQVAESDSAKYTAHFTVQTEKGETLGEAEVLLGDVLRSEHLCISNRAYKLSSKVASSSDAEATLRVTVALRYVADFSNVQFDALTSAPRGAEMQKPVAELAPEAGLHGLGRVRLSFTYDEETRVANVTVLKCAKLSSRDGSQCFVSVRLLPSDKQIWTTRVVLGTNPSINEMFSFVISPDELQEGYFCVAVRYDSLAIRIRRWFTNDKAQLGEIRHVPLGAVRAAMLSGMTTLTNWYDLSPSSCDDNCN